MSHSLLNDNANQKEKRSHETKNNEKVRYNHANTMVSILKYKKIVKIVNEEMKPGSQVSNGSEWAGIARGTPDVA